MRPGYSKYSTAVTLLFLPGLSVAGPPVPYGGWNQLNGQISTGCAGPGVVSCNIQVQDANFLQEEIVAEIAGGGTYSFIRQVVTDPNDANAVVNQLLAPGQLNFSSESYVAFAVNGAPLPPNSFFAYQGVAVKQVVRDSTYGNFVDVAEIQRANFKRNIHPVPYETTAGGALVDPALEDQFNVKLSQSFEDAAGDLSIGFDFVNYTLPDNTFGQSSAAPDSDRVRGYKTDITTNVATGDTSGGVTPTSTFVHQQRAGSSGYDTVFFMPDGSPAWITNNSTADPANELGGTPVTWGNGERITSTFIAQDSPIVDGSTVAAFAYRNMTTAGGIDAREVGLNVGGPVIPFAWDSDNVDNFGPAPVFNPAP